MSKANFSDDFKRDAVRQITERGHPVSEVSERLGVSAHSRKRSIDRARLITMHKDGVGATDIAKTLRIGRSTVYKLLKDAQ